MKIYKEYKNLIAQNDEYTTPAEIKSKLPLPPGLIFYPKFARIIINSNRKAVKKVYDRYNWIDSSLKIMQALEKAGLKFHITGMDNIKKVEGPVLFIGNHMSTLETVVLPCVINPIKPVVFVVKKELTTYPFFGPINNARHPIVVGRSNAREDLILVMQQGADRIKEGRSIILFPQKTRSTDFDIKSFNTLGVKLAKRNSVPVIPIALLTDAWANGKKIKELGKIDPSRKVHIAFGEPIEITGNGSEQHQKVIEFVTDNLKEWGREDYIKY